MLTDPRVQDLVDKYPATESFPLEVNHVEHEDGRSWAILCHFHMEYKQAYTIIDMDTGDVEASKVSYEVMLEGLEELLKDAEGQED